MGLGGGLRGSYVARDADPFVVGLAAGAALDAEGVVEGVLRGICRREVRHAVVHGRCVSYDGVSHWPDAARGL